MNDNQKDIIFEEFFSELKFNESNHTYEYKYSYLPSVTKIMGPLSDAIYKNIDPEILKIAAARGTAIHYATELLDNYGVIEIKEEWMPYLKAYMAAKKEYVWETLAVELRGFHKYLLYAGTIDRIILLEEKVYILDLKTTVELHPDLVAVQCSAYKEILKSHGIEVDGIATLQLKKDGTYRFEFLEDKTDIFMSLLKIHNFKKTLKGEN